MLVTYWLEYTFFSSLDVFFLFLSFDRISHQRVFREDLWSTSPIDLYCICSGLGVASIVTTQLQHKTKMGWQHNAVEPTTTTTTKLSLLLSLLTAQLASRDLSVQVYSHTQSSVATLYYVFAAELASNFSKNLKRKNFKIILSGNKQSQTTGPDFVQMLLWPL